MDISYFFSLIAIFLPLIFGLFLFGKRMALSTVNKKVLNTGLITVNSISLGFFLIEYLFIIIGKSLNFDFSFFTTDKISLNFGLMADASNIKFLVYSSLIYLLTSIYAAFYFDRKKQFIFTKQRYYTYFSLLIFNTYIFLASINLFQALIFYILQGVVIFLFAYFDIFKNNANFNITRFHKISLIGDFFFLIACLILFKYSMLSKGYVQSSSINMDELSTLISYCRGIASLSEFKIITVSFAIAALSKLFIFPLNCYWSFFANSSNILYLTIIGAANTSIGAYLYTRLIPFVDFYKDFSLYILIFAGITILSSLIFILFEKNIKIIFGYLFTVLNAVFIVCYINLNHTFAILLYFALNLVLLFILMRLFFKDVNNLNKRIINKKKGFLLESIHIMFFETIPSKVFQVFNFFDEKIIQKIFDLLIAILNFFVSILTIKTARNTTFKNIRNILIIVGLFVILAILCALFGGYKC